MYSGRGYGLITWKNKLRVAYLESKYCIKLNKHKLKFNGNVRSVIELKVLFWCFRSGYKYEYKN